jgi:hypothetical protein
MWRKILRLILGGAISGGLAYACFYVAEDSSDQATKFFFIFLLPNFTISFFIFGLFPILCNKIGLVIPRAEFHAKMKKVREDSGVPQV